MKLLQCEVENFGSYKHLEFDFSNASLSLIHGATGSGKSTLQDIACWILYGITAKDGKVDDIKSWNADNSPTIGKLEVRLQNETICVTRIRGKANENDLYWYSPDSIAPTFNRGKDISDTQRLLNEFLGVDADLFITGSYFCEFNPASNFFIAKSADQRETLEKLAILDLPTTLAEKIKEKKKEIKVDIKAVELESAKLQGKLSQLIVSSEKLVVLHNSWELENQRAFRDISNKYSNFDRAKASKLKDLNSKSDNWEADKNKKLERIINIIEDLNSSIKERQSHLTEDSCPTCGNPNNKNFKIKDTVYRYELDKSLLRKDLTITSDSTNPYPVQIQETEKLINVYEEQLLTIQREMNPYLRQQHENKQEIKIIESSIDTLNISLKEAKRRYESLNTLYDLSFELRAELLRKAISEVETETNTSLDAFFDAAIRVSLTLEGSDSLKVDISKDGHPCSFKQLSKGQRQLLKLCFGVSVMKAAANKAGVHFDTLYFDEALDGLDIDLKLKAFRLFESLSKDHDSVFLIDHAPEFQNLFLKKYHVQLVDDSSIIEVDE